MLGLAGGQDAENHRPAPLLLFPAADWCWRPLAHSESSAWDVPDCRGAEARLGKENSVKENLHDIYREQRFAAGDRLPFESWSRISFFTPVTSISSVCARVKMPRISVACQIIRELGEPKKKNVWSRTSFDLAFNARGEPHTLDWDQHRSTFDLAGRGVCTRRDRICSFTQLLGLKDNNCSFIWHKPFQAQ